MIPIQASQIAQIVGGVLHGEDIEVHAPAFLTSADCIPGSIFLAIKGERVDGHDFIDDAFGHGAVVALSTRVGGKRCIVVPDVTIAIGALASYLRDQLNQLTVIAITGSQGKTTSKELLASLLSEHGETVATRGNNNNELGVPLTLLRCDHTTRYCIIEMGARHIGDITALAAIVRPHIGVVLRVAAAHIGEFGSIERIAEAKSELISALGEAGIAILGEYDKFTPEMHRLHQGRTITFGESATAAIRATDIELREGRAHFDLVTPEGRSSVTLRQYGLHQVPNALAAAAVAHALGIATDEIAAALSTAEMGAKMRMEVSELHDLTLINDSYNASPDSMAAALLTLAHLTQERGGESWAFLGNMRELGETSVQSHAAIGALCSDLGIDHLVTIAAPDYAQGWNVDSQTSLHACKDQSEAITLAGHLHRGDVILCKGSRSEKLEVLAEGLIELWNKKIATEEDGQG
jgi:UDP-N-acetylmuramoyl-tripeptide--D-alanyl-D-alanine ligase